MTATKAAAPQMAPLFSKDAFALLKAEHDTVSELLSEYEKIHSTAKKAEEESVHEPVAEPGQLFSFVGAAILLTIMNLVRRGSAR